MFTNLAIERGPHIAGFAIVGDFAHRNHRTSFQIQMTFLYFVPNLKAQRRVF